VNNTNNLWKFQKDLQEGKRAEKEVLKLISRTNKDSVIGSTHITDVALDKQGIDCYITGSDGSVYSADVKSYTFQIHVAENRGWFNQGQVLCLEVAGGPQSACFSEHWKPTDLVLYFWAGMNPKKIGLDKFQKYLNKGYTSHLIFEYSFAHYLTENSDEIASNFRGAKLLGNNYSKGSFLNITVETLLEIRKNWIKAGGCYNPFVDSFNQDHFNLYNLQFFQQFSACDSLDRRPQRVL
jgi:hypothetical protein